MCMLICFNLQNYHKWKLFHTDLNFIFENIWNNEGNMFEPGLLVLWMKWKSRYSVTSNSLEMMLSLYCFVITEDKQPPPAPEPKTPPSSPDTRPRSTDQRTPRKSTEKEIFEDKRGKISCILPLLTHLFVCLFGVGLYSHMSEDIFGQSTKEISWEQWSSKAGTIDHGS